MPPICVISYCSQASVKSVYGGKSRGRPNHIVKGELWQTTHLRHLFLLYSQTSVKNMYSIWREIQEPTSTYAFFMPSLSSSAQWLTKLPTLIVCFSRGTTVASGMKHVFIVEYIGDDIRRTAGWTLDFARCIFIFCVMRSFVVCSGLLHCHGWAEKDNFVSRATLHDKFYYARKSITSGVQ